MANGTLKRRFSVLGAACLLGVAAIPSGAQEGQTPVFGSTVSMTRIKAAALDDAGRPVPGLGAEDFRVFDDGQERDIRLVLDPEAAPLDLGLVLDYSTSVADTWPDARERVHAFLEALDPEDCVYLLPFNSRVGPGIHARPGDDGLRRVVDDFPMWGATRLYDALFDAYAALAAARQARSCATAGDVGDGTGERRQAIVVLTDGADEGSGRAYRDILVRAWRSDLPVFPVAVGMAALDDVDLDGYRTLGASQAAIREIRTMREQLAELARVSGGRMVTQREIRDGYAEVLALLRGYYVIGYRTPEPRTRGWHRVEVRISGDRSRRVIVQPGYYGAAVDPRPIQDALDAARGALRQRDFRTALHWFEIARGFDVDMGLPDLGAGFAHEALGQLSAARDAYHRSLDRYPGLAAAHLRLAAVSLRLADPAASREHAVRAEAGGEDVDEIVADLRVRDPGAPDLESLRSRPVLFLVSPAEPSLEAQLDLGVLLQALGRALEARTDVMLVRRPQAATHYLNLRVDRTGDGAFRGALELWNTEGRRLEDEGLRIEDLGDDDLVAAVAPRLQELLRGLIRE